MRAVIFAVFISALIYAPLSAVSAQEIDANQIRALSGYKSYGTLSSFTKHLREDPVLYRALSSNQKLSEKILGSTTLQRKLLSDINKSGDSQGVVSSYVNEFSQTGDVTGNAFGQTDSFTRQEQQREKRRELNRQQLTGDEENQQNSQHLGGFSGGNANLAAQRAIEKAQREKEAADRHAKEVIAKAQAQLDAKNQQDRFEQEMLQFKVIQDMIAQMAHDPAALEAFFADTAMIQKLMDKEMTIEDAMAKLGVTPAPGTTAPAPDPIPHTTPDPSDDTIFGDGFEGGGNEGLVHVSGNHYKLKGMDVWDMNHIPDPSEQALDANGWPKYLNVPASCPPPRENTEYLHRAHYNYDGGGDPDHPFYGRAGTSLGDMGAHIANYFIKGTTWSYTSLRIGSPDEGIMSEEIAYPFVSPAQPEKKFQAKIIGLNLASATEVQSISHCPGDFTGFTPEGKVPLSEGCKGGWNTTTFRPKPVITAVKYYGDKGHNVDCELKPGQRYFHNFQPYQVHQLINENGVLSDAEFAGKWNHSGRVGEKDDFGWAMPPYANACLGSGDDKTSAFPVNYPPQVYSGRNGHVSCGRMRAFQSGCENREMRSVCYDVTGEMPPAEFVRECQGGNLVWVKGYGEKALSTFRCENFKNNGDFAHNSGPVCAAHREGEIRKGVVRTELGYVVHNQYQCQYDKDLNRYDWHLVSSENKGRSDGRSTAGMVEPPNGAPTFAPVPHKETCSWNGVEHPLGTKMIQNITDRGSFSNKRVGKHTYICMQRSPEPALPRFTHTEIKVSPEVPFRFFANGDKVYSVTFEKPTTDAPNCEGRQPAGMVPAESCFYGTSKSCLEYPEIFGQFPGIPGGREILTKRNEYIAMEFNTGEFKRLRGSWNFSALPVSVPGGHGPRITSISKCPGDFERQKIANEMNSSDCYVKSEGVRQSVSWKQRGVSGARCPLEPNTTYYFNILYTDAQSGTPPSQLHWKCAGPSSGISVCGALTSPK